jgi:SPP1 gp7 family putative phage head morphogenesis protein
MNTNTEDPELKNLISDILQKFLGFFATNTLQQEISRLVGEKYYDGMEKAEVQFNFNATPSQHTLQFLQKYSFDNIKGLEEDTKERLRKEITQGMLNQEHPNLLKKRIRDVMDVTIERAKMISITETNRALNMGHYEAAKQSGLNLVKQWSTQNERMSRAGNKVPCSICEEMDGKIVGMDKKFKFSDGESLLLPPRHPNCACRVLYVQKEDINNNI